MPLRSIQKHGDHRFTPRQLAVRAITLNAAIGCMLALIVILVAHGSHQAYAQQARDNAKSLAAIAQASVSAELGRWEALMRAAESELAALPKSGIHRDDAINRVLDAHRRLMPGADALRVTDVNGDIRWGNDLPTHNSVNLADHPYIKEAAVNPGAMFIGGPLESRVSGKWVIALSRAISLDGKVAGVMYVTVRADYFGQLFSAYEVDGEDTLNLRLQDLTLIARFSPASSMSTKAGAVPISPELSASIADNIDNGVFDSSSPIDGIVRTTAYKRVSGWPLIVFAGIAHKRFFAPWRAQVWQISALAAGAWTVIGLAALALYRAGRKEMHIGQELNTQVRRTQSLLKAAGDGIHIINSEGTLIGASDSFAEMLMAEPSTLLGRHVSSWDPTQCGATFDTWIARVHPGSRHRMEVRYRRDDETWLEVDLQLSVVDLDGDKLVYGSARDITERKQLLATLAESASQIRDLYDHAPCGYYSIDASGKFEHVNAAMLSWLGSSSDDILGKAYITDFLDENGKKIFIKSFEQLKTAGRLNDIELLLISRNGQPRWLRESATAVRDKTGAFLRSRSVTQDITAQRTANDQIARLLLDQAAMLDNDVVGMIKVQDRHIVWKNRALDRIFGYSPDALAGASTHVLYADQASYDLVGHEAYPLLRQGQTYRNQLQMRRKDGDLIWVDLSGVSLSRGESMWTVADINAVKLAQTHAEHIAFHDALTGLPNRVLLSDRLRQAISIATRTCTKLAVCYLDLDGFKAVNDLYGHDAGDWVLSEVGRRMLSVLRNDDTASRVGGDEFVMLLALLDHADEGIYVIERLMTALHKPIALPSGTVIQVGASVGISVSPDDGNVPESLLIKADHAMLRAKRTGKGRVVRASEAQSTDFSQFE